ncbi:alpha/beta hydrolase [Azorhizobium doebereinerae]|uniref:alpha/beta hydrolase n=1 Tax=Azorhizobium doebereinerae TaxID=281091 RepID=UPI000414A2BF|nr:alpha/beta hydrolase-fold protein [Azorhizobium doebereinerae]
MQLLSPSRRAAPAPEPPEAAGRPRTGRWRLEAGGRMLRVEASWPEAPPPPGGHPFLVMLDGNAYFFTLLEAVRVRTLRPGSTLAEPVVIGLGYETDGAFDLAQRERDYTPPGAAAFLDALADDLLPRLAGLLSLDLSAGTLLGHSYGGLFVLQALFARPGLFRTSVALSPSVWRGRAAVQAGEAAFADRLAAAPGPLALLLAAGGLEQATTRTGDAAVDARLAEHRVAEEAQALAGRLARLAPERLAVRFDLIAGENHGSVVPAALSRAVSFALQPETPR